MDAEQESIEIGEEDSTQKGGKQDEVLDAKHGAEAVERSSDLGAGLFTIH